MVGTTTAIVVLSRQSLVLASLSAGPPDQWYAGIRAEDGGIVLCVAYIACKQANQPADGHILPVVVVVAGATNCNQQCDKQRYHSDAEPPGVAASPAIKGVQLGANVIGNETETRKGD